MANHAGFTAWPSRFSVRSCAAAAKHIRFRFVKVKGHSGDKYNDLADRLAKDALGIQ